MNLANMTLRAFFKKLSSSTPTPAGGAASAVVGGMAAALVAMMARLTLNKRGKEYQLVVAEMEDIVQRADLLRDELLDLADRDSKAFDRVMAAYRLPKSGKSEQAKRQQAVQDALKGATEVPHRIAAACEEVLELAQQAAAKGVRSAVSDAGTAASLAEAGLHAALLNVDINLQTIQDGRFRRLYHKKCTDLAKQARIRRDAILAIVEDWIRPE